MVINKNIALRIKQLRKEQGWTQKELAEKTGLGLQTIIGYENERREPNSRAMSALEKVFNVSGSYLRGDSNNKRSDVFMKQEEDGFTRVDLPTDFLQKYLCNVTNDLINKKEEFKRMQIYNSYSNSKYKYITDSLESEIAMLEIVVDRIQQALE